MSNINTKDMTIIYSAKVKNLQDRHENELDKIRNNHKKNKLELASQNEREILNIKSQLEAKKLQEMNKHQQTLEKLKENTEIVKQKTRNEIKNLNNNLKARKTNQQEQFSSQIQARMAQQSMQMEDLEDSYNEEIRKLNRKLKNKKEQAKYDGRTQLADVKSKNQNNIYEEKTQYRIKKDFLDDKHHIELNTQEKRHKNYLAKQENDFQKKTRIRKTEYDKIVKKVEVDGQSRNKTKQVLFEKKYSQLNNNHEKVIANLNSRKETIINKLKNDILKTHQLNYNKTRDPFYTKITLEPKVTKLPNRDFQLELDIPKTEVNKLKIYAQNKEVKLVFDRDFQNKIENPDGSVDQISKVETITKKVKVDEILKPESISKKYKDGKLLINIKRA